MQLDGRVVVVTGASRGIGVSIARDLAARGAHVVLSARDAAALEEVAAAIRADGGQASAVAADVSRPDDRGRLVAAAEAAGPIEALINNAGVEFPASVAAHHAEEVEREVAVNLLAPIHLTRAVLPGMLARGRGCVVVISSMSGKSATPYNAVYAATKHGVNGFMASLRPELRGTGVRAGVVCPSFVADAGMWADMELKPPTLLREVSLARVVAGVHKVLRGAPEVLVTPTPMRPLLALGQLFPRLNEALLRWMGILPTLQERARVTAARRSGAEPIARGGPAPRPDGDEGGHG